MRREGQGRGERGEVTRGEGRGEGRGGEGQREAKERWRERKRGAKQRGEKKGIKMRGIHNFSCNGCSGGVQTRPQLALKLACSFRPLSFLHL